MVLGLPRSARRRVRGVRRRSRAGARFGAAARRAWPRSRVPCNSSRWGRRFFSPPTRGPTGCTGGSRPSMTRTRIAMRPTAFRTIRPSRCDRDRLARLDDCLRARVHARLGAARARRRLVRRCALRGSTSRSRLSPCSVRLRSPRACRGVPRSLLRSSGGTRCSPCTSPAAGTTTPGSCCSCSARSRRRASGKRQLAGVCWAVGALVKWIPLVLLPLRALEARAQRPPRRSPGIRDRRRGGRRHRVRALRHGVAARVRAARAQRQPRDAVGTAAPARAARRAARSLDRALRRRLPGRVRVAGAGGMARDARGSASRRARSCSRRRTSSSGTSCWAVPLAAAEDDEPAALLSLALCAYLLRQTIPL